MNKFMKQFNKDPEARKFLEEMVSSAVASQRTQLDNQIAEYDGLIAQQKEIITQQKEELSELEARTRRSGVVLGDTPTDINLADFIDLAKGVSDKAYGAILNSIGLQALEAGYNGTKLNELTLSSWQDSGMSVSSLYTEITRNDLQKAHRQGASISVQNREIDVRDLKETYEPCLDRSHQELVFSVEKDDLGKDEGSSYVTEKGMMFYVSGKGKWKNQLQEDLSKILDAYLMGVVLRESQMGIMTKAGEIMVLHGLEKHKPLLTEVANGGDMNQYFANNFLAAYEAQEN